MTVSRAKNIHTIHQLLSDADVTQDVKTSFFVYRLQHACYHQVMLPDKEDLWRTLYNRRYTDLQVSYTKDYQWTQSSFQYGLAQYVSQQGTPIEDDGRLSWLVLRAGEIAREAIEGVDISFEWFKVDVSELDNALKRIEVLDEKNYFKACLRLVMIEAWRQQEWEESERDGSIPGKILESLDERIPDDTGTIDWGVFISEEFMGWWAFLMIQTWKYIDLGPVYRRASPDKVSKSQVCLVKGLLEQGMSLFENGMLEESKVVFEQSLITANTISRDYYKSRVLGRIAKILSEHGMIEQAITTANTISDDSDKSYTLGEIAKSLCEQGRMEEALITANTISDGKSKTEALCDIALILLEHGKIEESKVIIEQAITTANTISRDYYKSRVLGRIAKTLAEQGMTEEAFTIANTIARDHARSQSLASISKSLSEQGRSSLLHQHLIKSSYSALLYESFLPEYQQTLTESSLLRASFLFSPFSHSLSQTSVYHFLNHHLRLQDEARTRAIIEHCPQLGLDFLLSSNPQ